MMAEWKRRQERARFEGDLAAFLEAGWRYIDPSPFVSGWHLEAIADHLQAVADGEIRRLIINVPPRSSKSSIVSVAFPAWLWARSQHGPLSGPHVQFLFASYAQSLSLRDSVKTRRLIESPWYQKFWGDRFKLTGDQNTKIRFENNQGGYRLATSVGGSLTGEGAAIIVCDDPNNAIEMESEVIRDGTNTWWDEALSTRLNDPKTGAYIIIQQRLHQDDLTGHILGRSQGEWVHLNLPMRYDPERHCSTSIGFDDPREADRELLCPERMGETEVVDLERRLGPYAASGQLQQSPVPKGGGIIKRSYWKLWEPKDGSKIFPPFELVIAFLDTAYTEKEENDPSAMTVWGVWRDADGNPQVMLTYAWTKRLEFNDLVEKSAVTCREYKVDRLLIESKAAGISVAQEIRRVHSRASFGVQLIDPKAQDKTARLYSIEHLFAEGLIWAPDRDWADACIDQCEAGPRGSHDDLADTTSGALRFLRDSGLLLRKEEAEFERIESMKYRRKSAPLYPA